MHTIGKLHTVYRITVQYTEQPSAVYKSAQPRVKRVTENAAHNANI